MLSGGERWPSFLITALAGLALVARATGQEVREYPGFPPGAEPAGTAAVLVVDGQTHRPIEGATVRTYAEVIEPTALHGEWVGEAKTDAYGLALVRKIADHFVVEARGYAPWWTFSIPDSPIELYPGRDLKGRLLDAEGAPLSGAAVDLVANCPHGPHVRHAVTGKDGLFVLRDVDLRHPHIATIVVPGRRSGAGEWLEPETFAALGDTSAPFALRPSVALSGSVVHADGTPVAGCVVRGPLWREAVRTDAAGAFTLRALSPDDEISIYAPDWKAGKEPFYTQKGFDPEVVLHVLYPPGPKAPRFRCRIDVFHAAGKTPVPGVALRAVRLSDGRLVRTTSSAEGHARMELPRGKYRIEAGNPFSRWHTPSPVDVQVDGETRASVAVVDDRARLDLVEKGVPQDASFRLVAGGAETWVSAGERPCLPQQGPAFVRVEAEGLTHFAQVGEAKDGVRRAEIAWPAPKVIRIPERVAVWPLTPPRLQVETKGKETLIRSQASGRIVMYADGFAVAVTLPAEPGGEVEVALPKPGLLRVPFPDGVDSVSVETGDGDGENVERSVGYWKSRNLHDGARLFLCCDGFATVSRTLSGDGPYHPAWGTATLEITVSGPEGFMLDLDGELYGSAGRTLSLRGLDPGPHTVIVGDEGFGSRRVDFTAKKGETTKLRLTLEPLSR